MRLALACAFALVCFLRPLVALADDGEARRHFEAGVRLYDASPPDFEGALAEFEAAYREKPSSLLRLNLALCLRALRRYPDAARELRTMLSEVDAAVPSVTRKAAERALRELDALVARVVVHAVARGSGGVPAGLELLVDGRMQDGWDGREPVDVGAGEHQFEVRAPGFSPASSPIVRTAAGETKTVEIELVLQERRRGRLVIDTDLGSVVRVDGGVGSPGGFDSEVEAGPHDVEVTLPSGRVFRDRVVVLLGEENAFTAHEGSSAAGITRAGRLAIDKPWSAELGVGMQGTSLHVLPAFGGVVEGERLAFVGPTVTVRGGRRFTRHFGVLIAAEFAELHGSRAAALDITIDELSAAVLVRYATEGRIAFVAGGGPGVVVRTAEAKVATTPSGVRPASGFGAMMVAEAAVVLRLLPVELSLGVHGDIHGVGGTRTEDDGVRVFSDTPAWRAGARLGVGVTF